MTCVCVARPRDVLRRHRSKRNHLRHPQFDSGLQSPYAPRVSTCLYARRLAGLVWRCPPLLFSPPFHSPVSPLPRSATRNTTQAAPEAGNETHVWHYFRSGQSGQSAQSTARHLSIVSLNHRRSAPLRRVQTWPLRSVASRRPLEIICDFEIFYKCLTIYFLINVYKDHYH